MKQSLGLPVQMQISDKLCAITLLVFMSGAIVRAMDSGNSIADKPDKAMELQDMSKTMTPQSSGQKANRSAEPISKSFVFKTVGDASLNMKIYYPPNWEEGAKKLPAIVFFYGGGWYGGDIGQFRETGPYLARRGMIVVTPEYRTINQHHVKPDQCLVDAKSAMRYVRTNAAKLGIDDNMIAAGGISAGGHLAAATAFSKGFDAPDDDLQVSCKPSALVLVVPVIDNGPGGFAHDQVKAYWEDFSPIHNISINPPPTLFMVGDKDKYIPVATAEKYKTEMEKQVGRCDLKIYENADHAFNFSPQGSKATTQDMDQFLVSLGYLKPEDRPIQK